MLKHFLFDPRGEDREDPLEKRWKTAFTKDEEGIDQWIS